MLRLLATRQLRYGAAGRVPLRTLCMASPALDGDSVMNLAANKATRFVYLRTLPLQKQPELADQVDTLAAGIESTTKTICERHADAIVDDRSAVHLHTAALAIATHRVLAPRLKNEVRLDNVIRAGFGAMPVGEVDRHAEKKRPDYWMVKMALLFAWDKMAAVRRMTENMRRDFGGGFECETRDVEDRHTLTVTKCLYHDICGKEGLPQLTRVFCALDRAIYSPITEEGQGIRFELKKTLADPPREGEAACEFRFTKMR